MKKFVSLLLTAFLVIFTFSGCSDENKKERLLTKIVIGASATPHSEILEHIKEAVKKSGYELEIVTYDDYILPNKALNEGEIDANYFQHKPYLDSYNAQNGTDLISAMAVHYEPFAVYGNEVESLSKLKRGAAIIIPEDDSNETRALLLLEQEGLIKLPNDEDAPREFTVHDVVDNGGYDIKTVQAGTVFEQLKKSEPGTIAVINGNYAIQAGLKIADALAVEDADGDAAQTYANIIAVKRGNNTSDKIQVLLNALTTDDVKDFINKKYKGAVVAIF